MTDDLLGDFIADTMFTVGGTAWAEGPYYRDDNVTVYAGDCMDMLKLLGNNTIDSVVTDPPYALAFMGKAFDTFAGPTEYQAWCQPWAAECLRVLKPGGFMLAFGGTRTAHRLACAIEDAGFEIRDSIAWLYGSGFPKSLDVSKAIDKAAGAEREVVGQRDRYRDGKERKNLGLRDNLYESGCSANGIADITTPATDAAKTWAGWGTALKPSYEPIIVARKPIQGTVAGNVLKHGTGALNIDGCRVGTDSTRRNNTAEMGYHGGNLAAEYQTGSTAGRWPPNVVLDGDTADMLDKQSGGKCGAHSVGAGASYPVNNTVYSQWTDRAPFDYGDSGGASRFFPTFRYTPKAAATERPTSDGVNHPTVKPLELMRWLIRLVTPPHGTVLDCFAGTATTGEAAILEHKRAILIEREPSYLPLIVARLHKPIQQGFDFEGELF